MLLRKYCRLLCAAFGFCPQISPAFVQPKNTVHFLFRCLPSVVEQDLSKMGISVKDVNAHEFTKALADFLKKTGKVKVPEWADIVKLGRFNELSPYDEDWFYIRAASVARHLYIRAPCGVGALSKVYGGNKRNGTAPSHNCRASATVTRRVLQALEALKMAEQDANTGGRRLTGQGRRDLDRIASQIKGGGKKAQK